MNLLNLNPEAVVLHQKHVANFKDALKEAQQENNPVLLFRVLNDVIASRRNKALTNLSEQNSNGKAHLFYMSRLLDYCRDHQRHFDLIAGNEWLENDVYFDAFNLICDPTLITDDFKEDNYIGYGLLLERITPFFPLYAEINYNNAIEGKPHAKWLFEMFKRNSYKR